MARWNYSNKQRYVDLGYIFTEIGDEFEIDVLDVPKHGHQVVKVLCDYCGREFDMIMSNYTKSTKNTNKVACGKCKNIKTQERLMERYGVKSPAQLQSSKEKTKQTSLERYGCENPMQNPDIKKKLVDTFVERYGVDSPAKLPQHAEAMKTFDVKKARRSYVRTCMEKYGVDNAAKVQSAKDKMRETCIERYGGKSSQCSPDVREKSWATLKSNGDIPSSKAERVMVSTLIELYGSEACFPQFILGRIAMDCLLVVDGVKIDVEYDGEFWHQNKKRQDMQRDFYCYRNGYKVLRFTSKYNTPTKEQIQDAVNYLVNSEHKHLIVPV